MKKLFSILGFSVHEEEEVPNQGVKTYFLRLPVSQVNLELLEPIDPESSVELFLRKKGPGVHHLSFECQTGQLSQVSQQLKEAGFLLIYDEPRLGAKGMRVNFIHPRTAGGILVEVMERSEYSGGEGSLCQSV